MFHSDDLVASKGFKAEWTSSVTSSAFQGELFSCDEVPYIYRWSRFNLSLDPPFLKAKWCHTILRGAFLKKLAYDDHLAFTFCVSFSSLALYKVTTFSLMTVNTNARIPYHFQSTKRPVSHWIEWLFFFFMYIMTKFRARIVLLFQDLLLRLLILFPAERAQSLFRSLTNY